MKKTKVLIPALALIAFSTVASIAGSVAWFTANRQTNIQAGTYAVVNTTANLKHTVTAGVATEVESATATVVTVADGNKLTDGSFNHTSGNIFQPNEQGSDFQEANPVVSATGAVNTIEPLLRRATLDADEDQYVYTAMTFKIKFTIEFTSKAGDYALFINTHNTLSGNSSNRTRFETTENTDDDDETEDSTAKGFRMGFYSESTNAQNRVVAALQTSANCHYVGTNTGDDAYDFDDSEHTWSSYSGDLVYDTYDAALPNASTARATVLARPDCLGHFAYTANTAVDLEYTVVAWFEGTDPEIVNRASLDDYQSVVAKLYFEAVPLADAPSNP